MVTIQQIEQLITDKEFRNIFPEFNKNFSYHDDLKAKTQDGVACSTCTLNKFKHNFQHIVTSINTAPGKFTKFTEFMSTKGTLVAPQEDKKPETVVTVFTKEYQNKKLLAADNFKLLAITKDQFRRLLRDSRVTEFLKTNQDFSAMGVEVYGIIEKYGFHSALALEKIYALYDIIWENESLFSTFVEFYKAANIKSIDYKELPQCRFISDPTLDGLEVAVNKIISGLKSPEISVTHAGDLFIATILTR